MAEESAPSFDPAPGHWTYVWGRAEGAPRAYSLKTGRQTDPSSEGTYLVKGDPGSVEIEGAYGAQGSPVPETRETLAPTGGRWRAEMSRHPGQILVKLEGSGLARAIEIKTTRRKGPKGMVRRLAQLRPLHDWAHARLGLCTTAFITGAACGTGRCARESAMGTTYVAKEKVAKEKQGRRREKERPLSLLLLSSPHST